MRIPEWIREWIMKDRLVYNKYRLSLEYLRRTKRVQFVKGVKDPETDKWISFVYVVNSKKYGKYRVKYNNGVYECNCPFFKHRRICSHILAVCQKTGIWPDKKTIFPRSHKE